MLGIGGIKKHKCFDF